MIRSVFERRIQNSDPRICDKPEVDRGGFYSGMFRKDSRPNQAAGGTNMQPPFKRTNSGGQLMGMLNGGGGGAGSKGQGLGCYEEEEDLYFEMEFPVINRSVCSEVGDTSYHSDSYGSQSTLDSRDSPYRDDLGRETVQGPLQPRDLQLVQGPRDRPNSLRIPGQSEFNRNNSFCSLPREKVRKIPRINLQNFSVPATPADNWIKDYLDDGDGSNYSSYTEYSPQSLSSARSKSRLSLNLGDSRSSSPSNKTSRSISRILRSSFSRLWGGGGNGNSGKNGGGSKDKARTPEPVLEARELLSTPGAGSTKSSPRPEYGKSWAGSSFTLERRESPFPEDNIGFVRSESPVTPITEEIVQQSIAKGLPIIPFACSSETVMEERRKHQRVKAALLQNQQASGASNSSDTFPVNVIRTPQTPGGRSLRDHLPGGRSPRDRLPDLPTGASMELRDSQDTRYLDTIQAGRNRMAISAPGSRKTSRKEDTILSYIYNHDSTSPYTETITEAENLNTNYEEDSNLASQNEDRSLNSLLLRAKLELEQEMERRKEAQGRRLRGYAANNSRALERRRSSDNCYVMMSPFDGTESAQEVTEDYDSDDVFEKEDIDTSDVISTKNLHVCNNSPALCGSLEDENPFLVEGINITKIISSSPSSIGNNNNDRNFPNSNIEIRIESDDHSSRLSSVMSVPKSKESSASSSSTAKSCYTNSPVSTETRRLGSSVGSSSSTGLGLSPMVRSRAGTGNSSCCTGPTSSGTVSPVSSISSLRSAGASGSKLRSPGMTYGPDYLPMDVGTKFSKKN